VVRNQKQWQQRAEAIREARKLSQQDQQPQPAWAEQQLEAASGAGLLFDRKIRELEELNRGLKGDLELLRASGECLKETSKEKEDLIAYLLRAKVQEDAIEDVTEGDLAVAEELESLAKETMLDNVRLRRDLLSITAEFERTVASQEQPAL